MKVLPFTILVPDDRSVISEYIEMAHFYPHLHRHDEWQITFIERGEGTLITGSEMHAFKAGDIFVIGSKMPHLFKSNPDYFKGDPELSIKACSIYFNPEGILASLFNLPEMKTLKTFFKKHKEGFKVPFKASKNIASHILDIQYATGSSVMFGFLKLMDRLQEMDDQVKPLCSKTYSLNVSESEGRRLSKIINYIMGRYNTQLSLEEIADIAFMTPQAFCRYFKKHTGHTFVSFLNEVRVNDACKNLIFREHAGCISEVAYNAGFNSITNFNRVFRTVTGHSPRGYIDSYTNVGKIA